MVHAFRIVLFLILSQLTMCVLLARVDAPTAQQQHQQLTLPVANVSNLMPFIKIIVTWNAQMIFPTTKTKQLASINA